MGSPPNFYSYSSGPGKICTPSEGRSDQRHRGKPPNPESRTSHFSTATGAIEGPTYTIHSTGRSSRSEETQSHPASKLSREERAVRATHRRHPLPGGHMDEGGERSWTRTSCHIARRAVVVHAARPIQPKRMVVRRNRLSTIQTRRMASASSRPSGTLTGNSRRLPSRNQAGTLHQRFPVNLEQYDSRTADDNRTD